MKPRIFYDNRLADAPITASTTATGFYANNVTDFRPYTWWKGTAMPATLTVDCGSAKSANSAFIYGHDLFTQGSTIEIRSSTDNFSASNVLQATSTPSTDDPFALVFAAASYRYWRVTVTGTTNPSLAIVAIGTRLEPDGYVQLDFDPLARKLIGQANVSDTGQPLGKVIDYAQWDQQVTFKRTSWSWVRSTFIPAYNSWLRAYPFGWQWNAGVDSTPYLVTMGDSLDTPHYSEYQTDVTFRLKAVI